MNKRSEYNSLEWQIIAGSIMIMIVSVLFLSDSGITGLVARSNVKQITLPENNQTPILIEKPVQIEAPSEQPVQVESTQPPPQIKTQSGCVTPVENLIINESTTLCSGTYYLNDPEGDGAIKIGADNVVLDCNGSQIIGNEIYNSRGIFSNYYNTTIKNCLISSYYLGMIISKGGFNIFNNTLVNDTNTDIAIDINVYSGVVYNNMIVNLLNSSYSPTGISVYAASYINVTNNNIIGTYKAIKANLANSLFIKKNNIENNTMYGISVIDSNYSVIVENTVISSRHNGIDINAYNCNISNNTIKYFYHSGIDLYESYDLLSSSNNFIFNNIIEGGEYSDGGIFIGSSNNNKVFNNTIYNLINTENSNVKGIQIDGYSNIEFNNEIIDNTIFNISGNVSYCIYDTGHNNSYINNNLSNCGSSPIRVTTSYLENNSYINSRFINNIQEEETANYLFWKDTLINITLKDIKKINITIYNFNTSANYNNVIITSNSNLLIQRNNTQLSIFNLSAPFNDVKNTSNGVILASNVDNYSITLSPNQQIEVGDFVEDPIYNYPPTIANLTLTDNFNCSGTVNDVDSNISINLSFIRNNITYSSTNTSSAIITPELIDLDTWKCNVTVSDETHTVSQVSNDIQVLINDPPSINITLSSPDNSTFYNLSCIINITDPDSSNITTNIAWYKNDILENEENKSGKNIVSIKEPTLNDVFYCTAVSNDTQNTSSAVSNSITIGNHTNIPPVIEVTLSSDLTCQGTVDKQSNITISYYKNSQLQEVFVTENNTFSTSQQSSSGEWYCQIQANDGINTTTTNSNTITISTQSSGGGGGSSSSSSSSYTPITKEVINESINTNFTSNVTKQVNSVEAINNNTPPIIESPLKDTVGKAFEITKNNNSQYIVFILTALILFIIVIKTAKPIQTDQKIIGYTQKALSLGYDYDAIRHVLRKQLSNSVIDHHFHILRLRNIGPNKQYKKPMTYNIQNRTIAITNIRNFIQNQKTNGFKDKHIEKILLQNGYPKELVKEALNTPY